jgi:hypothetical protein
LPGVVLGTIGYMAPEQVRGLQTDHRSDIFAFGAILYEMLSGQRAFQRETAAETMTAILKDDPVTLPTSERHIPPALARIVDRCLEKNAAARFKSADDLAFALETLSAHSDAAVPAAIGGRTALLSHLRLAWSVAAVLAVGVVALAIVATLSVRRTASPTRPVTRLELNLPPGVELFTFNGDTVAVSPDGTRVAFIGVLGAVRQIYVRALDGLDAVPIRGTDNAWMCFFSPDGRSIGFIAADFVLRTVSLADGLVATVASQHGLRGRCLGVGRSHRVRSLRSTVAGVRLGTRARAVDDAGRPTQGGAPSLADRPSWGQRDSVCFHGKQRRRAHRSAGACDPRETGDRRARNSPAVHAERALDLLP